VGPTALRSLSTRGVAYGLTFLTGAAGLVYQVVWQRYLAQLLGSDSLAVATVLGVFLGGLSLGYLVCGKLTLHVNDVLRTYGLLEGLIGVWAFCFPWLFRATDAMTGSWSFAPPWGLALQGAACGVILMGVPTLCMGATVPMLTKGLTVSLEQATRVHARIYAVNTAGAFLGALAAAFVLIHRFGLPGTVRIAAAINVVTAVFFVVVRIPAQVCDEDEPIATHASRRGRGPKHAKSDASRRPAAWTLYAIAFTCGVYFMTLESLMVRITNLSMGSSSYTFAMIVAVFVLSIAWGSYRVARRAQISPQALLNNQIGICLSLMVLFLTLDKWPYAAHVLRTAFSGTLSAFVLYYASVFAVLLLVLLIPVGCMGATLPLAFHSLRRDVEGVGASAGVLLSWNALGNLIGGLVGGFLIFRWMDNGEVFLSGLLLAACTAGLATVWLPTGQRVKAALLGVIVVLFAVTYPGFDPLRFAVGTFRLRSAVDYSYGGANAFYRGYYENRNVLAYKDEPGGTFAVVENPSPVVALAQRFPGLVASVLGERAAELTEEARPRSIVVNGKSDSSTFYDRETLKLVAHLPGLLGHKRERVMIVGLGTGVTAGEFTLYPDVVTIDVAEISPSVVEFLPLFEDATYKVQDDPRLRIHLGDAFRVLRRSKAKWNIIASEPSNPWMNGVAAMFSREFYRLVREHLEPDGIFLQWIQRYATSEEISGISINTLRSEFPYVRVFRTEGTDDLMLASLEPIGDEAFERAEALLESNDALRASLASIGISRASQLMEKEHPEVLRRAAEFRDLGFETLDYPRIHTMAGWAFFSGQSIDNEGGLLGL
jgi:spermidine synthase